MVTIQQTDDFKNWMYGLKDSFARAAITARIRRLSFGNRGDSKSVGEGVYELRIERIARKLEIDT